MKPAKSGRAARSPTEAGESGDKSPLSRGAGSRAGPGDESLGTKNPDKWEHFKVWHLVGLLLGAFAFTVPLRAAVVTSSPNLPVGCPDGIYLTLAEVHATSKRGHPLA